ncbi:peptidyl-prolyl cis-trans isomerase [Puccinia sorghi]|uniref:peptidylprolyl isomerase n=1 Tax=Puccinia sorghi TaxID=27349 RepID=A0A0L6UAG8_9BASI|nr:peptidyl-prolyl cis-trans isomerase [Puccinia sorghi]
MPGAHDITPIRTASCRLASSTSRRSVISKHKRGTSYREWEMHYTGTLKSTGAKFDSSHDRDQLVIHCSSALIGCARNLTPSALTSSRPFEFTLGAKQVIQGWDQGLLDMCIGEKRKLVIPPKMGYGDAGAGGLIPGGATLVFDVEVSMMLPSDAVIASDLPDLSF